ncbi:transposase family protein [Nocardia nepalensis]|uniref:transposase family protein n=1 Tax=Nocardia nepalensis TaxID=3375448 RepID=UPI003B6755A4
MRLEVHGEAESAACPDCGKVSDRVHSRYMRRLTDLSIGGGECVSVCRPEGFDSQ